ncbi:unnamed protein product, partial [Discosporangium mesarthrocarpum]
GGESITLRGILPEEEELEEDELETLREVEERLDSNKAQLEYKDQKIRTIQQEVKNLVERGRKRQGQGQGQGPGKGIVQGEVGEAQMLEELEAEIRDLQGARGTIRVLFSSLVVARRGQKQKAGVAKSLKGRLDEATAALEEAQERAQTEQRSFDRKLTHLTTEFERRISGLINHTGMSSLLQSALSTGSSDGARAGPGAGAGAEAGSGAGAVEGGIGREGSETGAVVQEWHAGEGGRKPTPSLSRRSSAPQNSLGVRG